MGNASDKIAETIKTNILAQKLIFENRAVYEIMCKNMAESDWPQLTIQQGLCTLHAG
jgi:hypothetical protein